MYGSSRVRRAAPAVRLPRSTAAAPQNGAWRVIFAFAVLAQGFTPAFVASAPPNDLPDQSDREITNLLSEMVSMAEAARSSAARGASATEVDDVKRAADEVFRLMWGLPSGRDGSRIEGEVPFYGWKERWQTDETAFDSAYAARYSGRGPSVQDPRHLGIIGRGRYVRGLLEAIIEEDRRPPAQRAHAEHVVIALNNVIGWMRMERGSIKNEIQPRVDLTRVWDAPKEFWLSSSDTGWAWEAFAQAINILKVHYDDVAEARGHAADMERLVARFLEGVDADGDGNVAPAMMEGGLLVAVEHWRRLTSGEAY